MVTLIRSGLLLLLLLSGCGWDGTPTRKNDFVPLTSIKISAELPAIEVSRTIAAQTSTKLKVTGNRAGLITDEDVTDQVVWSSASPDSPDSQPAASFPYATSPNKNRVKGGLAGGKVIITAKVGGVSADYTLTVSNATVDSMVITPVDPSIPKGLSKQFSVRGTFSDATTQDLTFDAAWTSSAQEVATVSDADSSRGLVQALAVGTSTISATFAGASGSTVMTVTDPVLESIALSLTNPSILTLTKVPFKATGTNSDGSTSDITSQVVWSSSNIAIATIAGDGTVTALTQGATTISATLGVVSQSTTLKTTGGNLTGITVTPATFTLVKDTTGRISATGSFSNDSKRDITGAVTWTAANTALASVTPSGGNLALLNPLAVTVVPTTITATSGTQTGTATLTVIAPQLLSIAILTTSSELTAGPLTAGTSARFTVTATFSGGTTQDVTTLCTWTSNDTAVATVGTGGLAAGKVTGVAAGSTTISATYTNNGITVSAPVPAAVTVRSRSLQTLTISPDISSVTVGNQATFKALAAYGDGTVKDVTEDVPPQSWTLDNPNVAILADSVNQPGLVVVVDRGSANLTASFGGKTQTATITVTGP